ncbi:MAG: prepilin-type N-terminal cleavage/methylation domain-containing protein [Olsenella sp.]|nr:prepilin-type N-terminal cleavage/methylation domain-containing protein [Olsenella sp.]
MKDMILAKKAELKKRGYKGFTLMEMLIVVAIIAVLVAIAIPVFTAQLNKARVEADAANIRSGYAAATAKVLSDAPTSVTVYHLNADGTVETTATNAFATQGETGTGTGAAQNIAGQSLTWGKGEGVTYTYDGSKITISIAS